MSLFIGYQLSKAWAYSHYCFISLHYFYWQTTAALAAFSRDCNCCHTFDCDDLSERSQEPKPWATLGDLDVAWLIISGRSISFLPRAWQYFVQFSICFQPMSLCSCRGCLLASPWSWHLDPKPPFSAQCLVAFLNLSYSSLDWFTFSKALMEAYVDSFDTDFVLF